MSNIPAAKAYHISYTVARSLVLRSALWLFLVEELEVFRFVGSWFLIIVLPPQRREDDLATFGGTKELGNTTR